MTFQKGTFGLQQHGFKYLKGAYWNLSVSELTEHILRRKEGFFSQTGVVTVYTGQHTGRAPQDRFVVDYPELETDIWWENNQALSPYHFHKLYDHVLAYFQNREAFVYNGLAAQHPRLRVPLRVITESAWQNLFARNMFIATEETLEPEYTVIVAPNCHAIPSEHGTRSETFIVIDLIEKVVLIGGTHYAGEIKKSIFSILNFLMPLQGVMSMHCAANYGADEKDVALFFGLSGTGKTTLSTDGSRVLVGDDEHGWGDEGVFNYEGGCYAKVIKLNPETEPEIFRAVHQYGTILENVVLDEESRRPDFADARYTENTRASYSLDQLPNAAPQGIAAAPKHIFFLTADAFGVLPPLSRLTPEQAQYHFWAGYTAKIAGTEKGLGKEPQATFSTCFGAPFMLLHPTVYAEMLSEKIQQHACQVWLVNTGWVGGAYGVGNRIPLPYTRALIRAVLAGELDQAEMETEPVFGLQIPKQVSFVPATILNPRLAWSDEAAYLRQAHQLAELFHQKFEAFAPFAPLAVRDAAPLF